MKVVEFLWWSAVAGNLVWLYLAVTRAYQGVKLLREERLHDGLKKLAWGFASAGVAALMPIGIFGHVFEFVDPELADMAAKLGLALCLLLLVYYLAAFLIQRTIGNELETKDRLLFTYMVTFFLAFFMYSNGEEKHMLDRLIILGVLVLAVLAWRPLHRHINAWGIIVLYIFLMASWMALVEPERGGGVGVALASIAFGVTFPLLFCRQKPIEERDVSVAHAVVHGLWDSLAREGLPPDEIERLKRLTPKERERVIAKLREPVYTYPRKVKHIYGTFPGDYIWDEDEHG